MTKILLVEDDKSLREIYGVRLMAEGYEIVSAGDGEEALALAIKERPALILSDVMMPKISGFDMLDILRSTSETKGIKVIMMTALSSEDQRARGEALGADRYLVKSQVGIEDVVRTVHDVIGDGAPAPAPVPSFPAAAPAPQPAPQPAEQPVAQPVQQPVEQPAPAPQPVYQPQPAPAPAYEPAQPLTVPAPQPAPAPAPVAPEPIAAPAPVPVSQPTFQPQPAPAPQPAFQPQPAPAPQPAFQPFQPAPTPQPQPSFQQPASNPLPQPTAPFSTDRPASLGDRIINPLPSADGIGQPGDIAAQMNQELDSNNNPFQQPPQQ
jgi:CheY-like chemotaxis protein